MTIKKKLCQECNKRPGIAWIWGKFLCGECWNSIRAKKIKENINIFIVL